MIRFYFFILFFFGVLHATSQQQFQLAVPLVRYSSLIFDHQTTVACSFDQAGTHIRYTLDGSEPGVNSNLYHKPVVISGKQVHFKAKVFGTSFYPSETIALTFINQGLPVRQVIGTMPSEKFKAGGLVSLHDGQGGQPDIGNGQWLGYEGDTSTWLLTLRKPAQPKQLLIHCLQQHGSWIFLPQKITVYALNNQTGQYTQAGELFTNPPSAESPGAAVPLIVALKDIGNTTQLKVICYPLTKIPDWHSGAGNKAWIFTDEIIVY